MRRLILLRHAKAEPSELGVDDRSRVLVERGRRDAARVGAYMGAQALVPDRALVSPAARTQETWKIAAAAFRPAPAAVSADQLYDAATQSILSVIKATPAAVHTLMVVGHNPSMHEIAVTLTGTGDGEARDRLREKLPTAGLVVIDFAVDDWSKLTAQSGRLERFVTPKSLESNKIKAR
jgi:phosphohistidine phosphatase